MTSRTFKCLSGLALLLAACSSDERSFGGSEEDAGADSSLDASGGSSGSAGASGGGAGTGGSAGTPSCSGREWFRSTFVFPDGNEIGVTETPVGPWHGLDGNPSLNGGRLIGPGTVAANQGETVPYDGAVLRFKTNLAASADLVSVRFNGDPSDASSGVGVSLSGMGEMKLVEGAAEASQAVPNLTTNTDYYVELRISGNSARTRVLTGGYTGTELASLEAAVTGSATGKSVSVAITSTSTSNVDEVFVTQCDAPPSYQSVLRDNFERAAGSVLGSPDQPASSVWQDSSGLSLQGGSLRVDYTATASVDQGQHVPHELLRLRYTLRMSNAYTGTLWRTIYNYGTDTPAGLAVFSILVKGSSPNLTLNTVVGAPSKDHTVTFKTSTKYFVEYVVDGGDAALMLRENSYSSPIVFAHVGTAIEGAATNQQFTFIGKGESNFQAFADDLVLERYTR